jgi:molybdopterin converting factor small subunit
VKITIRLFGVFRIGRFKEEVRELPAGSSVGSVLELLEVKKGTRLGTVLVNGVHAGPDARLADGDEVTLLPILEGG